MKKLVIMMSMLLLTEMSFGAGFALYEFSGRSTAMGGAVLANEAEPASLTMNPSLITKLEGTQVQVGVTAVQPHATESLNGNARDIEDKTWFLPNMYFTHKWSDEISFGLGAFTRYGLGGSYKDYETWPGAFLAYDVSLETISFTPELAVKFSDELSMAMGLEAMTIEFHQKLKNSEGVSTGTPTPNTGKKFEMEGDGISWGGNFSLDYRPNWAPKWELGAVYKTKIKHNLKGSFRTSDPSWDYTRLTDRITMGSMTGSINLPDSLSAGISFRPIDNLVLEMGIVGTFWSTYNQITIEYANREEAPTIHNKKLYKDTYRLNFGAEYLLTENWAIRGSYVYDKSPINEKAMDNLLPVDDRHIVSVGCGYKIDRWSVDLAYAHLFAEDLSGTHLDTGYTMEYTNGKSDMFALTFGYKF